MDKPGLRRADAKAKEGLFQEALIETAASLGRRWNRSISFWTGSDQKQCFFLEGRYPVNEDRRDYRRSLDLLNGALRGGGLRLGGLRLLRAAVHVVFGEPLKAQTDLAAAGRLEPECVWVPLWRFRSRLVTLTAQAASGFQGSLREEVAAALQDIQRALDLDAQLPTPYQWRAELHRLLDNDTAALPDFQKLAVLDPDWRWNAYALMGKMTAGCDMAQLIADWEALDAPSEYRYCLRARMRALEADVDGALADLDFALAQNPRVGEVFAWRGETKRRLGRYSEADKDLAQARALDPQCMHGFLWGARTRVALGDPRGAVALVEQAAHLVAPITHWRHLIRGEARARLGDFTGAVRDFDLVYPASPRDSWTGKAAALAKDLDAAVEAEPREPFRRVMRGRMLLEARDVKAGLSDLRAAALAAPKQAAVAAALGLGFSQAGDDVEARKALDRAIKSELQYGLAFVWRGQLSLREGKRREGMSDLDEAVKRLNSGWAFAWRGIALFEAGEKDRALDDLEEAVLRGAKSSEVFYWLGEGRLRKKNMPAALAALDLSIKLGRRYDRGPASVEGTMSRVRAHLSRSRVRMALGDLEGQRLDSLAALKEARRLP